MEVSRAMTFEQHKELTASDCEVIAAEITALAANVRRGDLKAFERFWIEGGTEEGDAKVNQLRELAILRYAYREEKQTEKQPAGVQV
jgi:hypothetical protein